MDITLYKFPLGGDNDRIESVHYNMSRRLRDGETLSNEELDWYDWAEKYLTITAKYNKPTKE